MDILGYLKSETSPNKGNLVGNSLVGTCLTLPNLEFLWVFFKYPKISKNGNPLFFPVYRQHDKVDLFDILLGRGGVSTH